jgi:hypothetical protein
MIVWSLLGEENREVFALFRPDAYLCKWEGPAALREALEKLMTPSADNRTHGE